MQWNGVKETCADFGGVIGRLGWGIWAPRVWNNAQPCALRHIVGAVLEIVERCWNIVGAVLEIVVEQPSLGLVGGGAGGHLGRRP